jgi:type III pantothenate kinase
MYLLIDVGNTRIKWRLLETEYTEKGAQTSYGNFDEFSLFLVQLKTSEINVWLAAVNKTAELSALLASAHFKSISIVQSQKAQCGVINSYLHPERMGVDRWLALIAAFNSTQRSDKKNGVIVVDAGSALTIDVLNAKGQHLGGYIVPGLLMAQRALFANTEQVIEYNDDINRIDDFTRSKKLGNNTKQCVEYGVIKQLIALVKQVAEEYPNFEVFFSGGDGEVLATFFETGVVDRDLVLKGLWQVRN